MEEPIGKEGERGEEERAGMSRKEKRKERKKMKRKQVRKEMAENEREEEERKINDPEEQRRVREMEEEEKERTERERKEFEERERMWLEEMERKRKEEEEKQRKVLEEEEEEEAKKLLQDEKEDDDDWEYVEEGPAEIIWQGNEIIVRKKKVRVPKRNVDQQSGKEDDADRPTSNPLPPQSEAFAEYQNVSAMVSAQQMLENVAQQVPNFGTEQDKAHCPFHLKTGACRFGHRCSRVHFYPDKACTLLIKNMYNGPGLAWEQDEGLEYTDEEVECSYEEFYEDVHTEFLKYGELVNFKVCRNGSFHLRGNVYVHYKSLDSALLAYHSISGRYFAGKQVNCEFVNVTRWKVAICGEYMKSRLKTCSRGTACNFIHCFRNPGGDYEWADWDKPPPRYWVKKMAALFGYSDEFVYEKQIKQEEFGQPRTTNRRKTAETDRHQVRRSRSRDTDCLIHSSSKSRDNGDDVQDGARWQTYTNDGCSHDSSSDAGELERDRDRDGERRKNRHHDRSRKRSECHSKESDHTTEYGEGNNRSHEIDSNEEWSDGDKKRQTHYSRTKISKHSRQRASIDDGGDCMNQVDGSQLDRDGDEEKWCYHLGRSSRHKTKVKSMDNLGDSKSRTHDIGSNGDWSDRDIDKGRERDRHNHRARKSLRNQDNALEFSDDHYTDRYRAHVIDSGDDQLAGDRKRHRSHRRKRLRRSESEFSDDERGTVKRLKEKPHGGESEMGKSHRKRNTADSYLNRRDHSSKKSGEADLRYSSIEEIDEQGRWKPESPERDRNSRKSDSVEGYESGSPFGHDRKSRSHDCGSDYSYNKKMDGHVGGESEDASGRHHKCSSSRTNDDKNTGKSSSWDRNSIELYKESKSRSSSRPRHERR